MQHSEMLKQKQVREVANVQSSSSSRLMELDSFWEVAEMIGLWVDFDKYMDFGQLDMWNGFFPTNWLLLRHQCMGNKSTYSSQGLQFSQWTTLPSVASPLLEAALHLQVDRVPLKPYSHASPSDMSVYMPCQHSG